MKLATKNIKQGFVGLSLHIEDDLEPSKIMEDSPQAQVLVHHWCGVWINGWDCSLRGSSKQENPTLIFTRCWQSLLVRWEQNIHNTTREKREIRRRRRFVQIWWLWTDLLRVSDWRPKRAWICAKLGELILHLGYFDLVSWFENWLCRASDLKGVLSVRVTAVSAQSSFDRWFIWVVKRCPIELKFGQ